MLNNPYNYILKLAPLLAPSSVGCSSACQLPFTQVGWEVVWSSLHQHSSTASDVPVPRWGTCTGEPHADLQAGPTWAASLIQAGSERCKFMKANPEGVVVSYRNGCYLSTPHFQTAVLHLKAISLVFSSQLWDVGLSAEVPAWVGPFHVSTSTQTSAVPASRALGIWGTSRPDWMCVCSLQASGLGKSSNHHPLNLSNHFPPTAWFLGPSDLQASLLPRSNEFRALSENSYLHIFKLNQTTHTHTHKPFSLPSGFLPCCMCRISYWCGNRAAEETP